MNLKNECRASGGTGEMSLWYFELTVITGSVTKANIKPITVLQTHCVKGCSKTFKNKADLISYKSLKW